MIEFWYEFASTYSYPAAMRVERMAEVLEPLIAEVGAAPLAVLEAAGRPAVKARLKDHVEQATARGVFGSPSFITADGELFWGNDRLEQALSWAQHHTSREHA